MKTYFCGGCPKELKPSEVWIAKRFYGKLVAFCSLECYKRFKTTEFHKLKDQGPDLEV